MREAESALFIETLSLGKQQPCLQYFLNPLLYCSPHGNIDTNASLGSLICLSLSIKSKLVLTLFAISIFLLPVVDVRVVEVNLKQMLEAGATDEQIVETIQLNLNKKHFSHGGIDSIL